MSLHHDAVFWECSTFGGTLWVTWPVAGCTHTPFKTSWGSAQQKLEDSALAQPMQFQGWSRLEPSVHMAEHACCALKCPCLVFEWQPRIFSFSFFSCGGEDKVTSLHSKLLTKTLSFIVVPFISTQFSISPQGLIRRVEWEERKNTFYSSLF